MRFFQLSTCRSISALASISARGAKDLSWRLSGLVSLADWIGSSTEFFHYRDPLDFSPRDYCLNVAQPKAREALHALRMTPSKPNQSANFATLFKANWPPSSAQAHCGELELSAGPMLVFIEDVTGSGKTESAFLLAQRMMVVGKGRGLFVALPTTAPLTQCMNVWRNAIDVCLLQTPPLPSLSHMGAVGCMKDFEPRSCPTRARQRVPLGVRSKPCRPPAPPSLRMIAARRSWRMSALARSTKRCSASCRQNTPRFGNWASPARFSIVDEAHAYDAYMSREVERLLTFHAGMGGSAIILSATLPRRMKEQYARAFRGGRHADGVALRCAAYPLVTQIPMRGAITETPLDTREDLKRSVAVTRIQDCDEALERVAEAAGKGAAVAYIRNSVDDAIEAFEALRAKGLEPILFHARFAMTDRLAIEGKALEIFGKKGTPDQRKGHVLVATQVVEQSLDLDFDLMVTDLAPVDLLVQRAGRLWRHQRGPRPISGPDFLVVSPEPVADAGKDWYEKIFPRGAYVYRAHALLWLSAKILFEKGAIVSPQGVRALVETVYGAGARDRIPEGLRKNFDDNEGAAFGDSSHAENNLLDFFSGYCPGDNKFWSSDIRTPTRLGEEQTLFRLAFWENGHLRPYVNNSDPTRAWALSEVSIRKWRAEVRGVYSHEVEAAAGALEKEWWEKTGDDAVVLPLDGEGPWRASVSDEKGNQKDAFYDRNFGLRIQSLKIDRA